ncbi:hypothetical protein N7495_004182 [Penicillium taxi]|uniref:uncharacterized protein n=1 Tax=Penicillium taxi TaxID=168475 RepID=UPI002544E10D|nr:uncharacterized protein N7495_004182 [Penicillium taxi]KAJ5899438.1 hypothetical protein N7495_004182 [Penicillium taxi]
MAAIKNLADNLNASVARLEAQNTASIARLEAQNTASAARLEAQIAALEDHVVRGFEELQTRAYNDMAKTMNSPAVTPEFLLSPLYSQRTGLEIPRCPATLRDLRRLSRKPGILWLNAIFIDVANLILDVTRAGGYISESVWTEETPAMSAYSEDAERLLTDALWYLLDARRSQFLIGGTCPLQRRRLNELQRGISGLNGVEDPVLTRCINRISRYSGIMIVTVSMLPMQTSLRILLHSRRLIC